MQIQGLGHAHNHGITFERESGMFNEIMISQQTRLGQAFHHFCDDYRIVGRRRREGGLCRCERDWPWRSRSWLLSQYCTVPRTVPYTVLRIALNSHHGHLAMWELVPTSRLPGRASVLLGGCFQASRVGGFINDSDQLRSNASPAHVYVVFSEYHRVPLIICIFFLSTAVPPPDIFPRSPFVEISGAPGKRIYHRTVRCLYTSRLAPTRSRPFQLSNACRFGLPIH
jgi:hypothetical protein